MKNFPGQGKVREVWFKYGKLAKHCKISGKSQGILKFCQNWDVYGSLRNFQKLINLRKIVIIVLLNDIKILRISLLPRLFDKKFQAVFEKKTEEYASCSVINEKGPFWKIWWLRAAFENIWKIGKSHGKVREFWNRKWVVTLNHEVTKQWWNFTKCIHS